MLPRLLCVLLLLLAPLLRGRAQPASWQRVALDSIGVATLEFPDSVSERRHNGLHTYVWRSDSTAYVATVKPVNGFASLIGHNSAQFYDGMVQQFLREVNGRLLQRHAIRVGAFEGVEIQFATPDKAQLPATKYTRLLLVNSNLYAVSHLSDAVPGPALAADRQRFFTSFQLNSQAADQHGQAYQVGKVLGALVALTVLLVFVTGLLVGMVLLWRRHSARGRP